MDFFLSLVIAGACVGSVYALVAVGLNLTFWTTKTLNFGQGAVMMLCAISTALLTAQGLSNGVAIIAGVAIVALVGVIVERIAVRPALKTAGSMGWVIATLGFGILLQGITSKFFGSQAIPFPEVLFTVQDVIDIGGQNISLQYVSIFVVSILIIVVLEGLTRYTVLGTAIRGTAQDMELAIVQGRCAGDGCIGMCISALTPQQLAVGGINSIGITEYIPEVDAGLCRGIAGFPVVDGDASTNFSVGFIRPMLATGFLVERVQPAVVAANKQNAAGQRGL